MYETFKRKCSGYSRNNGNSVEDVALQLKPAHFLNIHLINVLIKIPEKKDIFEIS